MNRRELERHLRHHGCLFVRHGAAHDIWRNAAGTKQASVPRHRIVVPWTARAICRQLQIPPP